MSSRWVAALLPCVTPAVAAVAVDRDSMLNKTVTDLVIAFLHYSSYPMVLTKSS